MTFVAADGEMGERGGKRLASYELQKVRRGSVAVVAVAVVVVLGYMNDVCKYVDGGLGCSHHTLLAPASVRDGTVLSGWVWVYFGSPYVQVSKERKFIGGTHGRTVVKITPHAWVEVWHDRALGET